MGLNLGSSRSPILKIHNIPLSKNHPLHFSLINFDSPIFSHITHPPPYACAREQGRKEIKGKERREAQVREEESVRIHRGRESGEKQRERERKGKGRERERREIKRDFYALSSLFLIFL